MLKLSKESTAKLGNELVQKMHTVDKKVNHMNYQKPERTITLAEATIIQTLGLKIGTDYLSPNTLSGLGYKSCIDITARQSINISDYLRINFS